MSQRNLENWRYSVLWARVPAWVDQVDLSNWYVHIPLVKCIGPGDYFSIGHNTRRFQNFARKIFNINFLFLEIYDSIANGCFQCMGLGNPYS